MSVQKLSLLIEKLIHSLHTEESEYIRSSKLRKLSSTQIHYIDLINHENKPTLSQLAKKLKVTKPSVTNTVDKLEKAGFVKKKQSNDDRRMQHLHLTKEGKRIAELHDNFHDVFTKKLVTNLNDKEIKQLTVNLDKALEEE